MKCSIALPGLTFEKRRDYLYARIQARRVDRQKALDFLTEIALECGGTGYKQMLIECETARKRADTALFLSFGDLVRLSTGVKMAFVNKYVALDEAAKYIPDIAGRADYKYFNASDEAEKWLVR